MAGLSAVLQPCGAGSCGETGAAVASQPAGSPPALPCPPAPLPHPDALRRQAAQKLLYRGAFSVGNPGGGWFYNPFDLSVKGEGASEGLLEWANVGA